MNTINKNIILFLFILFCGYTKVLAQTSPEDSISIYKQIKNASEVSKTNLDSSEQLLESILIECKKREMNGLIAICNKNLGVTYAKKGKFEKGIEVTQKALSYYYSNNDTNNIVDIHGNLGIMLEIIQKFNDAIENYNKVIQLFSNKNDSRLGHIYGSRGLSYISIGEIEKGEDDLIKSQTIAYLNNDSLTLQTSYSNLAKFYIERGNLQKAKKYLNLANELLMSSTNYYQLAINYVNIAEIYSKEGDIGNAEKYFKKSIAILRDINEIESLYKVYYDFSKMYEKHNKADKALEYYKKYNEIKDSLLNEKTLSSINELNVKYKTKEKEQQLKIKETEIEKQQIQATKEKTQRYGLIIVLTVVLIFSGFLYNRLTLIKKQKIIIEQQKSQVENQKIVVEEKNKEITDSISYAKRLQEAILPSISQIKNTFPESFIIYKPKDIVAGDFYWMETINNITYIAVADCTGHGVPGAMVSVVCSNALNRAVKEFKIKEPAKILDKTAKLVVETFEKSGENVKDGMDISLCGINKNNNIIEWAGANNPLWIIRNNELIEFKPDKQPISKHINYKDFTNHSIPLKVNDCIYLFSDGFVDQFGGEKNKKYKTAKFKNLIISNSRKSFSEQQKSIENDFNQWKGNIEQVDDICIIGIQPFT